MALWTSLEVAKLAAACATPMVVTTIGLVLLRRVESVKSQIASSAEFSNKWAELFFEAAHGFMTSVERTLALIYHLQSRPDKDDPIGTRYNSELIELALRPG